MQRRDVRKEKVRELNLQLQKDALTSEVPKETAFREEQRTKAGIFYLSQTCWTFMSASSFS